jgi:hypothetical protein
VDLALSGKVALVTGGSRGIGQAIARRLAGEGESDVKAAQQVRVDYTNGTLQVTGPKARAFDFSRKTRSVDVSIELPSGSQVSAEMQVGDFRCAGRLRMPSPRLWSDLSHACHKDRSRGVLRPNPGTEETPWLRTLMSS